ncbi:unnamed protein product [Albugo candida]|uniref:Uncharacterized protein n=1 Tax=Albugo candida TaxID=65357 RepID=A0A024G8H7_9STRA|nr:unnamed protein product [Albugo candida]|eukprot:CCI42845.1 unnamed protein product [Albugo candida]
MPFFSTQMFRIACSKNRLDILCIMIRNGFDVGQVAIRNTLHKIIERVDSDESATSLQSLIRFLVESGMNVNWQMSMRSRMIECHCNAPYHSAKDIKYILSKQSAAHRDVATPWSSRDLENALRSNGIHKYNVDQLLTHDIAFNTSHVTYTCLNTSFNCDLSFLSDRCANVIDLITYDHNSFQVSSFSVSATIFLLIQSIFCE